MRRCYTGEVDYGIHKVGDFKSLVGKPVTVAMVDEYLQRQQTYLRAGVQ